MIVTLTPNPAIDQTYRVPELLVGESHRVPAPARRAGGKGLNTAAVLAQLGVEHCCVAAVDQQLLSWWQGDLAAREVQHRTVPVAAPYRTRASTAIVDADGVATVLNEAGEALPAPTWGQIEAAVLSALDSTPRSVLAICGSLPQEGALEPLLHLVSATRAAGHAVVVDGSGPWLRDVAALGPELVKCNLAEAVESTGMTDPTDAVQELLRIGAQAALISLGADGVLLVTDPASPVWGDSEQRWRARPGSELRGNPTGAGDAATSAAAQWLVEGSMDREQLLRSVVATSAAAVLQPLAGEVDPADIARLAADVSIESF